MISKKEQEVLALNKAYESYYYCLYNKNANLKLHVDVIINSQDAQYVYRFSRDFSKDISRANIKKLQEIIINYSDSWYIYWFAFYVKNSNKKKLFKALLKTNDKECINLFVNNIELPQELKELVIFI